MNTGSKLDKLNTIYRTAWINENAFVIEEIVEREDGLVQEGKSMANVRKLLGKAQVKPAVEMAGFLSDRGDLQAQATLMELVKLKQLDRHEGIHHGLRLTRNVDDRPIDLFNLAVLYVSASADGPKQADLEKGLYWMIKAFYLHPGKELGDWVQTLEELVCAQAQAPLRTCARARHDEILRSIDTRKAIKRMIELTAKKHEKSPPG